MTHVDDTVVSPYNSKRWRQTIHGWTFLVVYVNVLSVVDRHRCTRQKVENSRALVFGYSSLVRSQRKTSASFRCVSIDCACVRCVHVADHAETGTSSFQQPDRSKAAASNPARRYLCYSAARKDDARIARIQRLFRKQEK